MSEFLTLQNMYRKIQEISYTNMYNLCYNDKLYLLVVYFFTCHGRERKT